MAVNYHLTMSSPKLGLSTAAIWEVIASTQTELAYLNQLTLGSSAKNPKCGDNYLKCDRCPTTLWALRKTTQSVTGDRSTVWALRKQPKSESTSPKHFGH